jgi:hypothetical protein
LGESYFDRGEIIPLIETGDKRKIKIKISKCGIGPVDKADMLVSSFLYSLEKRFLRRVKAGSVF